MEPWKQTYTGVMYTPLDPKVEQIDIRDIAHALALQCRFGGHCRTFYSVADHSLLVGDEAARICGDEDRRPLAMLVGLLHDAAEAYVGDMVRPLKYLPELVGYRSIERQTQRVIWRAFGLEARAADVYALVKVADDTLLATEARDLMGPPPSPWAVMPPPRPYKIEPRSVEHAEAAFLQRFYSLRDLAGLS